MAARRYDIPRIVHGPSVSVSLPRKGSDSFRTLTELADGTMMVGFCDSGVVSFEHVATKGLDDNSNRGQCLEATIQLADWKRRTYENVVMVDEDLVACTLRASPYVELFSLTNRCCVGDMNLLRGCPREVVRLKTYPDMLVAVMDTSLVFWDSSNQRQLRIISKLSLDGGGVKSNLCELEDGTLMLGMKKSSLILVSPKQMEVLSRVKKATHKVDVIYCVTEIRKNVVALSTWSKGNYHNVVKVISLDVQKQEQQQRPQRQQQNIKFLCEVLGCEKRPVVKFAEGMFLVLSSRLAIEGWNDQGEQWMRINSRMQYEIRTSREWLKVLSDGKVAHMTHGGTLNVYDCYYKEYGSKTCRVE